MFLEDGRTFALCTKSGDRTLFSWVPTCVDKGAVSVPFSGICLRRLPKRDPTVVGHTLRRPHRLAFMRWEDRLRGSCALPRRRLARE